MTPSFDELRYRDPWLGLVERFGKDVAIEWLIIWDALNHWDRSKAMVETFGSSLEPVAKNLIATPTVLEDAEDNRFLLIKKDDYETRLSAQCQKVLKELDAWLLYDP